LRRNQFAPSLLMAAADCRRGWTRPVARRASWQTEQLQFHCGTPPPAAVPNRRMRMGRNVRMHV
jgi:hypothetical protein